MTIRIETNNKQLSEKVLWLLSHFTKDGLTISKEESPNTNPSNKDIFTHTKGLLSSKSIDPIEWQNNIRNEWNR